MVLRYSPWTSMQLMLNLVAEDNITDLFLNDWQPTSPQSTIQQKHFQVLTEVMTEVFLHCGLVVDECVIEVTNYQDFLKVLLLHYPDVYQPCKPVILQQTRVPNSLPMGINYVDYEPQGTEVIQACLQTTP